MNWYKKEAKFNDYEETYKKIKKELISKGIDKDPTADEVQKKMLQEEFSYNKKPLEV